MKHLFDAWHEVEPVIQEREVLLFLDYDGTLTPIAERPEMARIVMVCGNRR